MNCLIYAVQYKKLLEHEKVTHLYRSKDFVEGFTYGMEAAISYLSYMPNLDTVQVRCKDCFFGCRLKDSELYKKSPYKYFKENSILCNCKEWGEDPTVVDTNGYCYFGAQKEQTDSLTLEDLQKMHGEPVWIQPIDSPEPGNWAIVSGVDIEDGEKTLYLQGDFVIMNYGDKYLAYSQKQKEKN